MKKNGWFGQDFVETAWRLDIPGKKKTYMQ